MILTERAFDKEALAFLQQGISDLILRFPLAGFSLLGTAVRIVESDGLPTMATDGRIIYYNPQWIRKMQERGPVWVRFDTLHEWLHVFNNHVARCGGRDKKLWNTACDMYVVQECINILSTPNERLDPPKDGVIPEPWSYGKSAEEIYEVLVKKADKKEYGVSDFLYEAAEEYSEPEEDSFYQKFLEELSQAAAIPAVVAQLPDRLKSRLVHITRGRAPWGRLLTGNLVSQMGYEFASYARPNRRFTPFLLRPTFRSYKERKLVIAVDVSASVDKNLLSKLGSNITPAAMRAEETIVCTFDAHIREIVRTKRPAKVLEELKFGMGDHQYTSVRDVFDLIDKENPSAYTIFTDGKVWLPDKPYHSTLWVLPGTGEPGGNITMPWGKTFHMETSW